MNRSPIIVPKVADGWVSHQIGLGVESYDLNELYSPDTELWKSKVLDLASPKYEPNKTYIFDRSRYRSHGTITGAIWRQLPSGLWYLDFDGSDDVVDCGSGASLDILNAISISLWVYPEGYGESNLGHAFHTTLDQWRMLYNGASPQIAFDLAKAGVGGQRVSSNAGSVPLNTWTKLDGTWNGTIQLIYVNGAVQTDTETWSGTLQTIGTGKLVLGDQTGGARAWNGGIALFRVYAEVAQTATQIAQGFQQERHLFGV